MQFIAEASKRPANEKKAAGLSLTLSEQTDIEDDRNWKYRELLKEPETGRYVTMACKARSATSSEIKSV